MALSPGTRVGTYEVMGTLGAGGMGEVYRARDAKLGRDVALKLLPPAFASDPERLARFNREAQVLASLNHPHIAQIYGFEESGDVRAFVMELVEGPTLADLVATGPVDPPEALRIARQIALALEAAHDRGITHRDLKPSNVKVAPDGSVKVLDFGLAKLSSSSDSSMQRSAIEVTASPTLMSPVLATGIGVILGTAVYMSPEQARGKTVDKRADIWAFGCVLFEMLTGRRAFDGDEVSDTLAGILRGDPDWSLIPSTISPTVLQYLKRCLAKDPAQRVHDIADVRLALEGAFDVPVETPATATSAPRGWKKTLATAGALAGAAVVVAVLGAFIARAAFPDAPPKVMRLTIVPSNGVAISPSQLDPDITVSRDGSRVAFVNFEQGRLALYVQALDRLETVRIENAGIPRSVFFSPDGESIGFFDGPAIKRVSANGGPPVTITATDGVGQGASWGEDGSIVFATNVGKGLMRIADAGSEVVQITTEAQGENHVLPEILPGGRAVLFTSAQAGLRGSNGQIAVVDLDSGTTRTLIAGGSHARYASSGHIVYGFSGTLRAVAFDIDTLTVRGTPVPVVERVVTKLSGAANFALSANGSLVYEAGDVVANAERNLVWVDRQGREEAVPGAERRAYVYPRISPDGSRVALDIRDKRSDIWVWHFARRTLQPLTFDPGLNRGVVWTPNSQRLIFSGESEGVESLFWQEADGSGTPDRLTTTTAGQSQVPYSITPDGSQLLYGQPGSPPFDLHTLQLDGERKQTPLLNAAHNEHNAEVSPNGRWLAYQSDESGANEVYVRRFPSLDSRSQVSSGGGTRPAWARNGRELFFLKTDGTMVSVPVESSDGASLVTGAPTPLFTGEYYFVQAGRTYDVSPDGKRFLMIKSAPSGTPSAALQLVVVLNWVEELKRLVPSK
jgi:Tol biopolymer transport system component